MDSFSNHYATLLPTYLFCVNFQIAYKLPTLFSAGEWSSHVDENDSSSGYTDKDISRERKNENISELYNPSHLCPVPPICGLMMTQR